jgi:RNA polymerase sigma-54 factor
MVLLQPKLSLKVAQRQILTPGLMQMVSVLALNKLELKEMINAEIVENPVLEEVEENVPLLDEMAGREAERDRSVEDVAVEAAREKKDPFDEIDFGSYFQDYLDPGFRTPHSFEESDKPSFENFLSQPSTLSDHLSWQLGSLSVSRQLRDAAEYVIGNLNEDGYLLATDEELLQGYFAERSGQIPEPANGVHAPVALDEEDEKQAGAILLEAVKLVQTLDPVGIATRSLRECLLVQVETRRREHELLSAKRRGPEAADLANGQAAPGSEPEAPAASPEDSAVPGAPGDDAHESKCQIFTLAASIVDKHLLLLQKRDLREMSKALRKPPEVIQQAIDFIRTLDPRPGQRYNRSEARLIEPDVAFVKRGDEYVVVMNEEDLPALRLNQGYRKLLSQDGTEKDVKDYVKERYRSALQLMRNIEQRKNTILRTCEAIVRRQREFLELGVDELKPMMIKDVAEEIGVHPSTVSRAVSSKYVHTAQGVFELRFFFSEGVNGPEGGSTPLMLLKRKVKKFIDDEDPRKPLTDDLIVSMLESQGIQVTRRTVAKYREDLRIPSTHQRRVRD